MLLKNVVLTYIFFSILNVYIEGKHNILFVIIDDLRPALGCYGDINAHTPNIDNFAKKSATFTHAYAQQSLCAPSRNSLLTARRPDTLHLYDFYSYWRDDVGNFTTMPEYLKNLGYKTMSVGKIFHPGISSNGSDDSPYSWSTKPFHPITNDYKNAAVCPEKNSTTLKRNLVCPVQVSKMPNKILPDMETLNVAKNILIEHSKDKQPFLLAVGFQKPHIPLKYPRRYLKFHPLNKFKMLNYSWPKPFSSVAYNPWNDIRKRDDVKALNLIFPWQKIPVNFAKKIVQSYYASVTYIDDLIGRLLNHLSVLNLEENTIVIITSDHGWSLGEHAEWAKYSNFEVALRVPLIISVPGLTHSIDKKSDAMKSSSNLRSINIVDETKDTGILITKNLCSNDNLIIDSVVELIDLFPTIANLAGDLIPICPSNDDFPLEYSNKNGIVNLCSEGLSLIPLLKAALSCQSIEWKNFAFSQYPRPGIEPSLRPNSDEPRLKDIKIMGYSLRTNKFRYTAWIKFNQEFMEADWNSMFAEELYDHILDPHEYFNFVDKPEYQLVKEKLKTIVKYGWRSKLYD